MASCLQSEARGEDLVVRFGGEEFLLVLPNSDIAIATQVAKRILKVVRAKMETTTSAGIAMYNQDLTFEQLVKHADNALYKAKRSGRDQFIINSD